VTPADERAGNREHKHRPEATGTVGADISLRVKFRPKRCQESDRGIVLRNEVKTKGLGSLPTRAAAPARPKGPSEGEGPVLC
jgi:hypothetical protein